MRVSVGQPGASRCGPRRQATRRWRAVARAAWTVTATWPRAAWTTKWPLFVLGTRRRHRLERVELLQHGRLHLGGRRHLAKLRDGHVHRRDVHAAAAVAEVVDGERDDARLEQLGQRLLDELGVARGALGHEVEQR